MLVKRLLALEGDWVTVPGRMDVEKIPKVLHWNETMELLQKI